MSLHVKILQNPPSDSKLWGIFPWQAHSIVNPFSYLSTKKLGAIQKIFNWTLLLNAAFIGIKIFTNRTEEVWESNLFNAALIGEGGMWLGKICNLCALSDRIVLVKNEDLVPVTNSVNAEVWGEESVVLNGTRH